MIIFKTMIIFIKLHVQTCLQTLPFYLNTIHVNVSTSWAKIKITFVESRRN